MSASSRASLVVGIGASAGGVEALRDFFAHVPATSGCAYVVILHLSPEHESKLDAILQNVAAIPVTRVSERVRVEPNHAYVAPPGQHLTMADGELVVAPNTQPEERRAPIDLFFRTLADTHETHAVAVVLSGTGANGSLGLRRIKECGGAVFVQEPREALFGEMPQNAIATGLVDDVLAVAAIPARIVAYQARLDTLGASGGPRRRPEGQQQALRAILALLRARTGNDFSNYKRATLLRRLERRSSVLGLPNLATYAAFLRDRPDETPALLTSLRISVATFFHDRAAFAALEHEILPRIFAGKGLGDQVRIWVVGCATGEEAYSIAMLCAEQTSDGLDAPSVLVFATDIDEAAVTRARRGLYTASDVAELAPERLRRFFAREDDRFRVRRELRERVLFAIHNLLTDPPFAHIDLIACRNVLSALSHSAQQRVAETLHFALNQGGYLFLGSAEAPDGYDDRFITLNREARLFQRSTVGRRAPHPIPPFVAPVATATSVPPAHEPLIPIDLHRRLLEQYAPPSLIVTPDYEVIHVSPRAARYLRLASGEPTTNLLLLIRPELLAPTRAALADAVQRQANVDTGAVTLRVDDHDERVAILARPVLHPGDAARGYILILFATDPLAQREAEVIQSAGGPTTQHLEEEVLRLRQELRSSSAQYEEQAELLGFTNEELRALNEELRASSEELQINKEELQSANEELRTVNQELKVKIEEVTLHSTNLQNLINAAEVATVILDRGLAIRLFTPAARRLFNLIPADRGRSLSDITHRMLDVDVLADVAQVLGSLQTVEREVYTADGEVYLLRALPYRADDDRIGGVILTFFDITERKRAEAQVRAALEAERVTRHAAEAASNRTAQLQAVTANLAGAITRPEVIQVMATQSAAATGAHTVVIALLDAADNQLEVAAWVGPTAVEARARRLPLEAPWPPAVAARTGQPIWLASQDEAEGQVPGFEQIMARHEGNAFAALPLQASHQVLGSISFSYAAPHPFPLEEQTFLRALAQQCAQAFERASFYTELLQSREQLQQLSERLIAVQEEERRHLARELHDEIGQALGGLSLMLASGAAQAPEAMTEQLAAAQRQVAGLIAQVRQRSLDLRPSMLDDLGLHPALVWYLTRYQEQTGIGLEVEFQGIAGRFAPHVELTAYRLVQEALTNIVRHAGVTHARVLVWVVDAHLMIEVSDEGRGFDLATVRRTHTSTGLAGMRERVALLGGELTIETAPGAGTRLFATLPLAFPTVLREDLR